MKKLKLNLQHFEGAEVLTRSQLKKVLGGDPVPTTTLGWGSCCINGDCGSVPCRSWITCNSTFTKC